MILKRTWVIIVCLIAFCAFSWFLYFHSNLFSSATPMGETDDLIKNIAAIAGAITSLAAAVYGALMKWIEFKAASLELDRAQLEIEKQRLELRSLQRKEAPKK